MHVAGAASTKVLELVGESTPGLEAQCLALAVPLAQRNVRSTVVCACRGPFAQALQDRGVAVHVLPVGDEPAWSAIAAMRALAEALPADVIRAHPGTHALGALVAALVRCPCLATPERAAPNMREIEAFCLVDSVHFAVPGDVAALAAQAAGMPRERVHEVPVALDRAALARAPGSLQVALGLAPGAKVIGYAGPLVHDAGPWQVLRAALPALRRDPGCAIVLDGEGSMAATLRQQAVGNGVAPRVHFVRTGRLAVDADLLVLPGRALADEHAALCAIAAGTPVIADAHGPLTALLAGVPGAALVDAQRADELADAIAESLGGAPLRHAPPPWLAQRHGAEAVADRLAALYARLGAAAAPLAAGEPRAALSAGR